MQPERAKPRLRLRWLLVGPALLFLWVVAQIDKTNVSLIIADHKFLSDLNLVGHNAQLGGLMSAFFVGYGISVFAWGFLVDRFGPRICAIAGSLAWCTLVLISSQVSDINSFLAIRFFLGVAEGNLWPVCNAMTNRWFPTREHSRAQAFWTAGATLGTASGVPIMTALMLANGWRGALMALSLVSLLPIVFFVFVKNRPREQNGLSRWELQEIESDRKIEGSIQPVHLGELLKTTPFWLVTISQFISAATLNTLIQWIPSYLTNARHLGFGRMGGWITAGYIFATVLAVVVGYIADRTMRRALTAGLSCLAFAVLVFPVLQLSSPVACAFAVATLIGSASITGSLNGALMHTMVRPEAIARATGVYAGIGNGSSAIGPWAFGFLISALGGKYWGGFAFLAGLNVVGTILYLVLDRISIRPISGEFLPTKVTAALSES